jgi:hypothetical protein
MTFDRAKNPSRLWAATLASLVLLVGAAGWLQWWHARSTDAWLEAVRLQQDRIVLALQWKSAVETVGERVLASNAATDPSLSALIDGRTRVGLGRAASMQARISRTAATAQDTVLLDRIAGERLAVMDLDRRMRELRTAGDGVALRSFVVDRYLPAIGSYAVALDDFVHLQLQQRDDLIAEMHQARRLVRLQSGCVAAMLLGLALVLARAMILPSRDPDDTADASGAEGPGPDGARAVASGLPVDPHAPPWRLGLRGGG